MRIAAIHSAKGKVFGTVEAGRFRPLLRLGSAVRDLRDVIALLADGRGAVAHGASVALRTVKLAAPVGPLAKNVMCVGKNYHDHAQEFARSGVDLSTASGASLPGWATSSSTCRPSSRRSPAASRSSPAT